MPGAIDRKDKTNSLISRILKEKGVFFNMFAHFFYFIHFTDPATAQDKPDGNFALKKH